MLLFNVVFFKFFAYRYLCTISWHSVRLHFHCIMSQCRLQRESLRHETRVTRKIESPAEFTTNPAPGALVFLETDLILIQHTNIFLKTVHVFSLPQLCTNFIAEDDAVLSYFAGHFVCTACKFSGWLCFMFGPLVLSFWVQPSWRFRKLPWNNTVDAIIL